MQLFNITFRDGHQILARGNCAANAGMTALAQRDRERGDNLAVIETIRVA